MPPLRRARCSALHTLDHPRTLTALHQPLAPPGRHRLSHLSGCGALDQGRERAAGFRWARQMEPTDQLRRFQLNAASRSPAQVIFGVPSRSGRVRPDRLGTPNFSFAAKSRVGRMELWSEAEP